MIKTIWMDIAGFEGQELLEKAMPFLAYERQEKLKKMKNPLAAKLSAGAGLLLFFALKENGLEHRVEEISTGRYGKPFLPESCFFFNLSHSGNLALCTYGDVPLGADIQQIKEALPGKTEKMLSLYEKEYLRKEKGRAEAFYRIWAQKESLLKWDGRGLRLQMESFCVVHNGLLAKEMCFEGKKIFFKSYEIPGYAVSICAEKPFFSSEAKNYDKSIKEILKSGNLR